MSGINRKKYHDLRLEDYGISREESLGMHIIDETDLSIEKAESETLTIHLGGITTADEMNHELQVSSYLN